MLREQSLTGVAIGSGWQGIVAYVNVGAYYFIGLPIGCVLGFKTSLGAAVSAGFFGCRGPWICRGTEGLTLDLYLCFREYGGG